MDLPIACTLTESELRERRRTVLDFIRRSAVEVGRIPGGYFCRFAPSSEVLTELGRLVDQERQCCPFLAFKIVVEAGHKPICLEITGPPQAEPFIADLVRR
jgi:hypothetical protein